MIIPCATAEARPPKLSLVHIDGFSLVNLAGGRPTIKPYGAREHGGLHEVRGRVVDAAGKPIAGAIVLVDRTFDLQAGNVLAAAGEVTDATGAFTIRDAPAGPSVAVALAGDDWSELVEIGDGPIALRVVGHGAVHASLTYDGHGDAFKLRLARSGDARFTARYETTTAGELTIPSLPIGTYTVSAGLAQAFGGGQSRSIDRELVVRAGQTSALDLAQAAGTTLVVDLHTKLTAVGFKYWLFTGTAPATAADARARTAKEHPPNLAVGGQIGRDPVAFHDLAPGTYAACAGLFDRHTMDAADAPIGCTKVVVRAGDDVREIAITVE